MSTIYDPFEGPAEYVVYVHVKPTKRNGVTREFTSRIRGAKSPEGAQKLIDEDRKSMNDTLSGLIDAPGTGGRTYRVFKSRGWDEISDQFK